MGDTRKAFERKGACFVAAMLVGLVLLLHVPTARAGRACADVGAACDIDAGTVEVSYVSDAHVKVGIQKVGGCETQYFDYAPGEITRYPLEMGNGNYKVLVYENTTGGWFKRVESYMVELELEDEQAVFCSRIRDVYWEPDGAMAKKAAGLVFGKNGTQGKAMAIYSYMTARYAYDDELAEDIRNGKCVAYVPSLEKTFESGRGTCYDLSSLYAAMCRSVGIPCRLVMGYVDGQYHAWNSVYDDKADEWVDLDVTYALGKLRLLPERYDRIDAGRYNTYRYY